MSQQVKQSRHGITAFMTRHSNVVYHQKQDVKVREGPAILRTGQGIKRCRPFVSSHTDCERS